WCRFAWHVMRRAAVRLCCTATSKRPTRSATIVTTTSSSIKVMPRVLRTGSLAPLCTIGYSGSVYCFTGWCQHAEICKKTEKNHGLDRRLAGRNSCLGRAERCCCSWRGASRTPGRDPAGAEHYASSEGCEDFLPKGLDAHSG